MNPTDFLSRVETLGGLAKNSRFTVSIVPPTTLAATVQAEAISFLCRTAEIPSVAFNTTEDRVYGIEVLKPYGVTYEPITLSFYNTNDFSPRKFWEDWMNHIQPYHSRNMTYYDNMIGDIKIYHYSEDAAKPSPGYQNYFAHLREAWPVSIQESELSWAEEDNDSAAFEVQIQYKYWSRLTANGLEPQGNAAAAGGEQTETIGSF
jgi:hypothetical protein